MFSLISFIFYHHLFSRLSVCFDEDLGTTIMESVGGKCYIIGLRELAKKNSKYQLMDVQFQLK